MFSFLSRKKDGETAVRQEDIVIIKGEREHPRLWISDRIHGFSKNAKRNDQNPPCFLCLPSPILKCCPWLLEENACCVSFGKVGVTHPENLNARNWTLKAAVFLNVYGLLLAVLAGASFLSIYSVVRYTSFSQVTITSANLTEYFLQPTTMSVGLYSVGFVDADDSIPETVIPYADFCDFMNNGDGLERIMNPANCHKCRDALPIWTISLFVSVALFLPTIATDILRLYPEYDMNCEKVHAAILSLLSLSGLALTWFSFVTRCLSSFPGRKSGVLGGGDDPNFGPVEIDFGFGVGMGCLIAAMALKFLAVMLNCCIPTPGITRSRRQQRRYEGLSYPT